MTEDQIEHAVARSFAQLDAFFDGDNSPLTQREYDDCAGKITVWAEAQYALLALSAVLR